MSQRMDVETARACFASDLAIATAAAGRGPAGPALPPAPPSVGATTTNQPAEQGRNSTSTAEPILDDDLDSSAATEEKDREERRQSALYRRSRRDRSSKRHASLRDATEEGFKLPPPRKQGEVASLEAAARSLEEQQSQRDAQQRAVDAAHQQEEGTSPSPGQTVAPATTRRIPLIVLL
ncbi:ensconsin-like [Schistocerca americana]|uniref:ensconsin-like n=1 Tax=Schistocerca americana TaxID=7009 RepID=UPI001F4F507A|nr:ensconsin-like [Schistocerca americana]